MRTEFIEKYNLYTPVSINTSILVVDDRQENLFAMGELIQTYFPNTQIVTALSGTKALEMTMENDFALILLDVQMPEMDGFETASLLRGRKKTSGIPIIFVTANYNSDIHIFKGYESGAVDFLSKPLNPKILASKIRIFLQLYEQREKLKQQNILLEKKLDELEKLYSKLEVSNKQLTEISMQDGLTGIANRRFFNDIFKQQWNRGKKLKSPLSLIMLDIDHFKAFNDNYGHLEGDSCLKMVANVLSEELCRQTDLVARYGGEEFVILLPDTDCEGAGIAAHRLRESIEELNIPHPGPWGDFLTISLGCCTVMPGDNIVSEQLLSNADEALYRAKANGRNCIEFCELHDHIGLIG